MKYSPIYFTFAVGVFLHGKAWSQIENEYTQYCNQHPGSEVACFDRRTLIYCMPIGGNWYGTWLANCPETLCCEANLSGCTLNCSDEVPTTVTPWPTSSTTPSLICNNGELKKHQQNCKGYYYCSQNAWIEAECPTGEYDDYRKSCVFGKECNNNL